MVLAAIEKGFTALGFSGHSYFELEKDISMSPVDQKEYIKQITALKLKYRNVIKIFCGIEQDIFSEKPQFDYEYKIGSVYYLLKDEKFIDIDLSAESAKENVQKYWRAVFVLHYIHH